MRRSGPIKGLAGLVFMIGIAAASSASAGEFRRLGMTIGADFFVETGSVHVGRESRAATILIVAPDDFDEDVEVEIRRMEFDCATPRARQVSSRIYTHDMVSVRETHDREDWQLVREDSVGVVLWDFVCRGEMPEGEDAETYPNARTAVRETLREYRESPE